MFSYGLVVQQVCHGATSSSGLHKVQASFYSNFPPQLQHQGSLLLQKLMITAPISQRTLLRKVQLTKHLEVIQEVHVASNNMLLVYNVGS